MYTASAILFAVFAVTKVVSSPAPEPFQPGRPGGGNGGNNGGVDVSCTEIVKTDQKGKTTRSSTCVTVTHIPTGTTGTAGQATCLPDGYKLPGCNAFIGTFCCAKACDMGTNECGAKAITTIVS